MKINSTDVGVFEVAVTPAETLAWMNGELKDLIDVNGAIDEATSHAIANGTAFVLIKVANSSTST